MEVVVFFILAVVAVAAGVGVIAQRSAVRSALFLLVNFCSLAGLYILLNAQFVAVVQVIVYAGAIVVLFLFIVMLLGMERMEESPGSSGSIQEGQSLRRFQWLAGVLLGVLLLAGIVWTLVPTGAEAIPPLTPVDNVAEIGVALLADFAVPFELVSVVLLVAIIGAVVLAKKRRGG
jgi:NADH-quinone oxidoreductase subunit J